MIAARESPCSTRDRSTRQVPQRRMFMNESRRLSVEVDRFVVKIRAA